jgi:hypothetical protein
LKFILHTTHHSLWSDLADRPENVTAGYHVESAESFTVRQCAWLGEGSVVALPDTFGHVNLYSSRAAACGNEVLLARFHADATVVNSIHAHPTLPIFATSGIEHTVRVWAPGF